MGKSRKRQGSRSGNCVSAVKRSTRIPNSARMSPVLQIYVGAWFQHHCHETLRTKIYPGLEKLERVIKYWHAVAAPNQSGSYPDLYNSWLNQLPWPQCRTFCPTQEGIDALGRNHPNFKGCVEDSGIFENFDLLNFANLPPYVGTILMQGYSITAVSRLKDLPNVKALFFCGYCDESSLTDSAFQYLSNLTSLNFKRDNSPTSLTDAALQHLSKLKCLYMPKCNQFTDCTFRHLSTFTVLYVKGCSVLTDSAFEHLPNLIRLNMAGCNQSTISSSAFQHLSKLKWLDMKDCDQTTINDSAFQHLSNLETLLMSGCYQETITNSAFSHLSNLKMLDAGDFFWCTIPDSAFLHLSKLTRLDMTQRAWSSLDRRSISDFAFQHLSSLTYRTSSGSFSSAPFVWMRIS